MTVSFDERITTERLVAEAMSWKGTPYRHQASCKGAGCDCLGLVRGVWRAFWPEPEQAPAYSPDWAEEKGSENLLEAAMRHLLPVPLNAIRPGHVLLFRYRAGYPAKHAGIMINEHQFLHAHHGSAVALAHLCGWWQRHLAGVFAFPFAVDESE
jgi:NlpC/P60 family putative phage cell wall peptidase